MKHFSADQAQQIQQLILDCGQLAEQMAVKEFEIFEKGPGDYVTSIDQMLDAQLASGFAALFPQDGVITEENTRSRKAFRRDYSRLWCIDPIDGTEDFMQRRQHYAVMVGLLHNYEPVAGWVYAPAFKQLYYGGPEWGLFQLTAGRPPEPLIPVEPAAPSADFCPVLIGDKDQRRFGEAIAHLIPEGQFYSLGSFGLKVMEVVCGRAGMYLYFNGRVKLWDTTGPLALAKAAGLVCCDLEGNPLSFEPDAIDPETLSHHQPILIGWSRYIETFYSDIRQAIASVTNS